MQWVVVHNTATLQYKFLRRNPALVLANFMVRDKEYRDAVLDFRKDGGTIYLDHGWYENDIVPLDDYFDAIAELRPKVVIAPDTERADSRNMTISFLNDPRFCRLRKKHRIFPMVVPQSLSGSVREWADNCADILEHTTGQNVLIGITRPAAVLRHLYEEYEHPYFQMLESYLPQWWCAEIFRFGCYCSLHSPRLNDLVRKKWAFVHYLGVSRSPFFTYFITDMKFFRGTRIYSFDTSLPLRMAFLKQNFDSPPHKYQQRTTTERAVEFNSWKPTPKDIEQIGLNCARFLQELARPWESLL